MIRNKQQNSTKLFIIIIASCIAAFGTMPYGFQFAQIFEPYNHMMAIIAGIFFAASAALANIALAIYSFLKSRTKQKIINRIYLMLISSISAVPIGCMCYFAYFHIFPIVLTIVLTAAVTIINAIIGYTAILNLIVEIKSLEVFAYSYQELICRILGFVIGAIVSLTAYMAAVHGITEIILSMNQWNNKHIINLACLIGFITWIPFAALFSNATQICAAKIYRYFSEFKTSIKKSSLFNLLLLFFSLCSGTAFAQTAIVFFNPDMNIPAICKTIAMQHFFSSFLVPCAFFCSFGVNYLALTNLFKVALKRKRAVNISQDVHYPATLVFLDKPSN